MVSTHQNPPAVRPPAEIARPGQTVGEEVADHLRAELGTVRLGYRPTDPRRDRIDLLAELCDRDTFQAVMKWLSSGKRRSQATRRAYADDIRFWAGFAADLGRTPFRLGGLGYEDITAWKLLQESRGAADRSTARRISSLSSLHEHAARRGWNDLVNPIDPEDHRPRIDRGNTSTSTPILEKPELLAVADAGADPFEALVVLLLYTLAGRVSEMCSLDMGERIVRPRRVSLDLTRKGGKPRILPLSPTVADLMDLHVGERTTGPLLLAPDGRPVDRFLVDRILTRRGKRAGVLGSRDLTPHVLRASRITHMIDDGKPLAEIQAFVDHADPATTVGYFVRRKAAERNGLLVDEADGLFAGIRDRWVTPAEPA